MLYYWTTLKSARGLVYTIGLREDDFREYQKISHTSIIKAYRGTMGQILWLAGIRDRRISKREKQKEMRKTLKDMKRVI